MLLNIFQEVSDPRRDQAKMYDLPHLLFFSVLAIASGAISYRGIHTFIESHFVFFKEHFDIERWKKAPAYCTIRYALIQLDPKELEKSFRKYAKKILTLDPNRYLLVSVDGKTVRGSFDHFAQETSIQVLSFFAQEKEIILAHEEIEDNKTNEIPVAQKLIKETGLTNCLFTFDALHCQKKLSK